MTSASFPLQDPCGLALRYVRVRVSMCAVRVHARAKDYFSLCFASVSLPLSCPSDILSSCQLDVLGGLTDPVKEAFLRKVASVNAVGEPLSSSYEILSAKKKCTAGSEIVCAVAGQSTGVVGLWRRCPVTSAFSSLLVDLPADWYFQFRSAH